MKKLLLLSALLIFACSSDEGNDDYDNNNSNQTFLEKYRDGVVRGFIAPEDEIRPENLDRIISHLSHHVLVDSYSQMKFLLSKNIIRKSKSSVLWNGSVGGVNLNKFKFKKKNRDLLRRKLKIAKNDFIFLYLGRINKDKGVIDLIEAFESLQESYKMFLILRRQKCKKLRFEFCGFQIHLILIF